MWKYQDHQVDGAVWALQTIRDYGMAYLAWQERTRKTGTALLTVENSKARTCLIITKKNAIPGWEKHFANLNLIKTYSLINYESLHKRTKGKNGKLVYKVKPEYLGHDMVILDEAHHAISAFPKPSTTWRSVAIACMGKPVLYLSATPYAEHLGLIYNQFKLCKYTPFKHKNGYEFFREYGIPKMNMTPYGLQESYSKFKDKEILDAMKHLFNFKTRAEVGIEHEPTVNLVKVPLSHETKTLMAEWEKHRLIEIDGITIAGDSDSKMRSVHYQLEGGTVKASDTVTIRLNTQEKIDYIIDNYNLDSIAIMAHFIEERKLLEEHIPEAVIYSSDGDAEGVDLSHMEKLVVYSMSFKTSKYTQRIARQANHDRDTPIEVDILVSDKPGVGFKVYKSVAIKKENFTKNSYELTE